MLVSYLCVFTSGWHISALRSCCPLLRADTSTISCLTLFLQRPISSKTSPEIQKGQIHTQFVSIAWLCSYKGPFRRKHPWNTRGSNIYDTWVNCSALFLQRPISSKTSPEIQKSPIYMSNISCIFCDTTIEPWASGHAKTHSCLDYKSVILQHRFIKAPRFHQFCF